MPRPRRRPDIRFKEEMKQDDTRMWESGMRTEVPEEFIEWLCTAKEVMEFKGVPKEMKVPLIATSLRGRAAT